MAPKISSKRKKGEASSSRQPEEHRRPPPPPRNPGNIKDRTIVWTTEEQRQRNFSLATHIWRWKALGSNNFWQLFQGITNFSLATHILPKTVNKKVHFTPAAQSDPRHIHVQARPRVHPSGSLGKNLSWHLSSESKSPLKGNHKTVFSVLKSKRLLLDLLQYSSS